MIADYLIAPSLNSLFITGLLLFIIFIFFIIYFKQFLRLPFYPKMMLLIAITIAIGIHGLIHLGLETKYNFNPYKWFNI
jgi:uncharacterized membrane protein (DUF485 family)